MMRPMTQRTQKKTTSSSPIIAACVFEISAQGDTQSTVQLLPDGEFTARDGRPFDANSWKIDARIAASVIARIDARQGDLVFDYEHQTLNTEWNGAPAPAAGWFKQLEYRPGEGLFATDVRWTDRARGFIEAKEYRYVSAVFSYLPTSGEVVEIHHAALTNYPALDGMSEVVSRAAARFTSTQPITEEENDMNKEMLKLLGLDEGASEQEIQAAIVALKARADQVGELEQSVAALKSGTPDPEKYVPIRVVEEMRTEIASLRTAQIESQVDDLVEIALSDGKLLPAQEEWARDLGTKDVAALKSYLDTAQPIAALKGSQTNGDEPEGEVDENGLTEAELAVCKATGQSAEDFAKAKGGNQ